MSARWATPPTSCGTRPRARRSSTPASPPGLWPGVVRRVVFIVLALVALVGYHDQLRILNVVLVVVIAVNGFLVRKYLAGSESRRYPGDPISPDAFGELLGRWQQIYGGPPPGPVAPGVRSPRWPPPGRPHAALFCTVPAIVDFLAAAGLARTRGVLLIPPDRWWPPAALTDALRADPTLPVLTLHDADLEGCRTADRLRAALAPGTRVVDVGLGPRAAAAAGPPVRRGPDEAAIAALPASVVAADRAWLAAGNTFALAALRPAKLLRHRRAGGGPGRGATGDHRSRPRADGLGGIPAVAGTRPLSTAAGDPPTRSLPGSRDPDPPDAHP